MPDEDEKGRRAAELDQTLRSSLRALRASIPDEIDQCQVCGKAYLPGEMAVDGGSYGVCLEDGRRLDLYLCPDCVLELADDIAALIPASHLDRLVEIVQRRAQNRPPREEPR